MQDICCVGQIMEGRLWNPLLIPAENRNSTALKLKDKVQAPEWQGQGKSDKGNTEKMQKLRNANDAFGNINSTYTRAL